MHTRRKILPFALISLLITSVVAAIAVPASRVHASPGLLTGRVFDKGIDEDGNGLFDSLEIKVEVSIMTPGTYYLSISGLKDSTISPYSYVSVYDNVYVSLNLGVQNVSLSFYGPTIKASGKTNLRFISSVYINAQYAYESDSRNDLAMSRAYSYLQFDAAFTNMEVGFKVFPNGTVDMDGTVDAPRLAYSAKDLNVSASVNVSSSSNDLAQISTNGYIAYPWLTKSMWPYNASTVSMLAKYAKEIGDLKFDLNATLKLPTGFSYRTYPYQYPYLYGVQYPWNSSDFSLSLDYSNDILNGELDATTVLPATLASIFPFNATDFSLKADYAGGMFTGNVTFYILPGFPVGDLTMTFEATRTRATALGNLTVIYGTYPSYPNPLVIDETFVKNLIANITSLEGVGAGSLYNLTNGLVELDPASSVVADPLTAPPGAIINFGLVLDGDFLGFIAYMMYSGPRTGYTDTVTYPGVYRLLNTTLNSIDRASLQLSYARVSKTAMLRLTFSDNLERLLTGLFTFPSDVTPIAVASGSMRPTLEVGDMVLVKNITSASEIKTGTYDGDIIAFMSPRYAGEIIVHRAVAKAYFDGIWYFQTKGDANSSPDYWNGPDTYNGMISEKLVVGKIVERIPVIGYILLLAQVYVYGYPASTLVKEIPGLIRDFLALVKSFKLDLTYRSVSKSFDLKLSFTFNILGLWNTVLPRLPELVQPAMKAFLTGLLTNIYAEIKSADIQFTYENGKAEWLATIVVEGDFTREINHIKNLYINEVVKTMPSQYQSFWLTINATWLDVSDLKATYRIAENSGFFSFEGFRAAAPTDSVDDTSFRLYRFFNLSTPQSAYATESPRGGEKLKLTVQGGNNGTHTLTLAWPSTLPAPDFVSDDKTTMIWNNRTISSLKALVFTPEYGSGIVYNGRTYSVITKSNGAVSPVAFDQPYKQISLTISGQTGTAGYANISIPKELLNANYNEWIIMINDQPIYYPNYQVKETATHTFLYFTFTYTSPVNIAIVGTTVVPEFQISSILPLLMVVAVAAVAIGKAGTRIRRKKQT